MGSAVVSGGVLFGGGANIIDMRCMVRVCSVLAGLPRTRSGITARSLQARRYLCWLDITVGDFFCLKKKEKG